MYEVVYDRIDDGGREFHSIVEIFEGTRAELQAYIRRMRKEGCYNITTTVVRESA